MLFLIALVATVLALVQNLAMFSLGMKEMAIMSFPLSFAGVFLLQIASIWIVYFCIRKLLRRHREAVLAGCMVIILGSAEIALPASYFTYLVQHAGRKHVLEQIRYEGSSIEALASDQSGRRFALTYTLRFPRTGHYLTFPADLGAAPNQVFGNYFTKLHPEYYDDNYEFNANGPYSFIVVFDTGTNQFDFFKEKANIDICDSKDYWMTCRVIGIGLEGVPAALAVKVPAGKYEPAVPADNIRDITERSIRLDGLKLKSETNTTGAPVEFSYAITNAGNKDVSIPGGDVDNIIGVNYGWEPVSESAKKTNVTPGIVRLGNAVAAGNAQFGSVHKSTVVPGERLIINDKIAPLGPLAPGEYKLHVYLFSRYATEMNKPEQDLVQQFSVIP